MRLCMNAYVIELSKTLSNIVKDFYQFPEVYLGHCQTSVTEFLCSLGVVRVLQKCFIVDFRQSPRYTSVFNTIYIQDFYTCQKLKTAANG